jgi:hypothetical protein
LSHNGRSARSGGAAVIYAAFIEEMPN